MRPVDTASAGRIRRLREELLEEGFGFVAAWSDLLLGEVAHALRPVTHERRVPSVGSIVHPVVDPPDWEDPTQLRVTVRCMDGLTAGGARRFADGLSSWLIRTAPPARDGTAAGPGVALAVFDRPASSERDLVVLAEVTGGTIVQRDPAGAVRVVGESGVLRWDGVSWHHEEPTRAWIDVATASASDGLGDPRVRLDLLEFAVHDLGANGIGAILLYRPGGVRAGAWERRLPPPPPLDVRRPADLAPLRHVLAQVDGAAVFDGAGILRELGVRLMASTSATADVEGHRGMRHTAGRRYSFDDPHATVIVVSEDGPVTVLRGGALLGRSEVT